MSGGNHFPPAPFGRRRVPIVRTAPVGAYRLLHCADPDGPLPRPGQFYMLAAVEGWGGGEGGRPYLPRAFSFLRAGPEELLFLLEEVGPGTRRLGRASPGEELWLAGPFGVGFTAPDEGRRPVLVGGGIGIVPLAGWQDELAGALTLLGFRDAVHAEGASLLAGARVATDDGSVGREGPVTDLLNDELARDGHASVYACGPPAMLERVREIAAERGIPAQLALESGMACGFGACFGCVVATRRGYIRLCLDGPVVAADELETPLAGSEAA